MDIHHDVLEPHHWKPWKLTLYSFSISLVSLGCLTYWVPGQLRTMIQK